jgi:hypothetical protein
MTLKEVATTRLMSQQISGSKFDNAKALVGWMGAMQAQDFNMAKWAIALRTPGLTEAALENAITAGDILRTHLLRPTWHFVSRDDIHWMLELTAPQIKASMRSRNKELELTEAIFKRADTLFEKALKGGQFLSRNELLAILMKAKIAVDNNRAAHLLLNAELNGILCSGPTERKMQTYALLRERVPVRKVFSREEALGMLALRYFTSHCPATLQDFTWWSGLSIGDARKGLESIKSKLVPEKVGTENYWLDNSFTGSTLKKPAVFLLPPYDEFMISYKDRTASLLLENTKTTISINGIFRPVIVVNGKVAGLWKRSLKGNTLIIETEYFQSQGKSTIAVVGKVARKFGEFLGMNVQMVYQEGQGRSVGV